MLDAFYNATALGVVWNAGGQIWRVAGHPFQSPGQRSKKELLRRIFAGFIIGRHAALDRECLMTLDQRLYRAAFPSLELVTF